MLFVHRQLCLETKFSKRFNMIHIHMWIRSRDIVVGIATGYVLDDRGVGVRVPVGSRIFSSSCRPDLLWGLSNPSYPLGTAGSFPGLTTNLQLVPRSRKCGSIHPFPHAPSLRSAKLSTETKVSRIYTLNTLSLRCVFAGCLAMASSTVNSSPSVFSGFCHRWLAAVSNFRWNLLI
jgi:hypothetical protein